MVNWDDFDQHQRQIYEEQQAMGDIRKSLFDFPSADVTKLLEKPMNPVDDFNGIITRDITTSNIASEREARDISFLLTSAVALDGCRDLFDIRVIKDKDGKLIKGDVEADKWLEATITDIKASANSLTATSKGLKGWLGELFVTLKRRGEIQAQFMPAKKSGLIK